MKSSLGQFDAVGPRTFFEQLCGFQENERIALMRISLLRMYSVSEQNRVVLYSVCGYLVMLSSCCSPSTYIGFCLPSLSTCCFQSLIGRVCHRDVAGIFQPSTAVNKQTTSDKCNSVLTTSHKSVIPFNCPKTSLYTTAYPWTYLRTGHLPATPITPPNLTFILESGAALRVMFLTTASSSALI